MDGLAEVESLNMQLYINAIRLYVLCTTKTERKYAEYLFLFIALILFTVLVLLHVFYISTPCCTSSFVPIISKNNNSHDGIITLHVVLPKFIEQEATSISFDDQQDDGANFEETKQLIDHEIYLLDSETIQIAHKQLGKNRNKPIMTFEYSNDIGLLYISKETLQKYQIHSETIYISLDHPCLGNLLARNFVYYTVGYETIFLNTFAKLFNFEGYVLIRAEQEVYHLDMLANMADYTDPFDLLIFNVLLFAFCYPFVFWSISLIIEVFSLGWQLRMLVTSILIRHYAPSVPASVYMSVFRSLIVLLCLLLGLVIVVSEILSDAMLAAMVIGLFTNCCFFSNVCARSPSSKLYFNMFFYVYFAGFMSYIFKFPLGFHYLALFIFAMLLFHCKIFFFNHFEITMFFNNPANTVIVRDRNSIFTILGINNLFNNNVNINGEDNDHDDHVNNVDVHHENEDDAQMFEHNEEYHEGEEEAFSGSNSNSNSSEEEEYPDGSYFDDDDNNSEGEYEIKSDGDDNNNDNDEELHNEELDENETKSDCELHQEEEEDEEEEGEEVDQNDAGNDETTGALEYDSSREENENKTEESEKENNIISGSNKTENLNLESSVAIDSDEEEHTADINLVAATTSSDDQ